VVVRLAVPEVAVTVKTYVPFGVPPAELDGEFPPPQPVIAMSKRIIAVVLCTCSVLFFNAIAGNSESIRATSSPRIPIGGAAGIALNENKAEARCGLVVTLTFTGTGFVSVGVTEPGFTEQVAPVGAPLQAREIGCVNAPAGVMLIV
jgi:hypothetical protein